MEEELKCPVCQQIYSKTKEPRMLTCGHTVCIQCLQQLLAQSQPSCPEDNEMLAFNQIEMFPKNFSLLKLASKYQEQQQSLSLNRSITSNAQLQLNSPSLSHSQSMQPDLHDKSSWNSDYCMKHEKDLDIVCMTDKQLICAYCSIFGTHKDHILRPFKEVMSEVAMKVDILIEMYQMVEQAPLCQEKTQEIFTSFENDLMTKKQLLVSNINGIFQELREVLENSQQQCLEQINKNANYIKTEIEKIKMAPNQIKQDALQ